METEAIGIYCANGCALAIEEDVDVNWHLHNLLISYKFGEKGSFQKSLKKLRPYLDDKLYDFFQELEELSLWTNPITGKKGF